VDYGEESEDEDTFQNVNPDKYVDLKKEYKMNCVFHNKFKKWVPVSVVDSGAHCVNINDLLFIGTKPYGGAKPEAKPYTKPYAKPYGEAKPYTKPYGEAKPYGETKPYTKPYGEAKPYTKPYTNPYTKPYTKPYGQKQYSDNSYR